MTEEYRFTAVGRNFSAEAVQLIGEELIKLAAKHKVAFSQIKTRQVYDDLIKNKKHPLWAHIDTSPDAAMQQHIKHQIRRMISCVRYERVDIPKLKRSERREAGREPSKLFESVKDTSEATAAEGGDPVASHVLVPEAIKSKIMSERIAEGKIDQVRRGWRALAEWGKQVDLPPRYARLTNAIDGALKRFDSDEN